MPARIALALGLLSVFVLLAVDRRRPPKPSFALWLPTIWMLIAASRPISSWMGRGGNNVEGNLTDRVALALLILLGCVILLRRQIDWGKVVRDNFWMLLFFLYISVSIIWTDVPFIALKRVIRSSGAVVMALIVMSEEAPLAAFERILRRCAYALLPLSIVFIKYFPDIGRAYGRWDGLEMWTGVTTQKNNLGALCAVSMVALVMGLWRKRLEPDTAPTKLQRYADITILVAALVLLGGAGKGTYSATAIAVALLGIFICVALFWRRHGGGFVPRHLGSLTVIATVAYVLAWNVITATGASMLGRRTDLTGRSTDIWPLVLKEADRHPILGSGYGGAWGLNGTLSTTLGLEQAHNGYLDVYLQLGIVGCVLLALFILEVCARIKRQYEYDRRWGVFGVAFLFMNLIYNLSESAFFDAYFGTGFVMASIVFSACNRTGIVGAPRNAPLGTRPVRGKDGVSDAAPVARERPREWSVKAPPPLHPRRPVTPTRGVRPPLRPAGAGRGSTRH